MINIIVFAVLLLIAVYLGGWVGNKIQPRFENWLKRVEKRIRKN